MDGLYKHVDTIFRHVNENLRKADMPPPDEGVRELVWKLNEAVSYTLIKNGLSPGKIYFLETIGNPNNSGRITQNQFSIDKNGIITSLHIILRDDQNREIYDSPPDIVDKKLARKLILRAVEKFFEE